MAVILFRKSGEHVPPVALNLFKNTVGLGLFLVTLPLFGAAYLPADRPLADWLVLLASGAVGIGIADSIFFAALNRLGAGRLAIVDCLYSPFVVLGSLLYLYEPVDAALFVGMALMVGAILLGAWQPGRTAASARERKLHVGVLLGVLATALMAFGIVIAKPVLNHSDVSWATTVRLVGGVAFLAVQSLGRRHRAAVREVFRPSRAWRVTLPSGIVGVYLAMFFWIAGMKYTHTTTASVLNQSSVLFIFVLATVVLREPLGWRKVAAIGMGFLGAVIVVF